MPGKLRRRGACLLGAIGAGALLISAASASAKTYAPNKTNDHAPNGCTHADCTLREAIIASNKRSGRDTVALRKKGPYTLQLIPGGLDGPKTGDLNITDPVTIEHPGKGRAIVDANQIDRAFIQTTSTTSDNYTKISKLVIRDGNAAGFGGGIELGLGLLGLSHSVVAGNTATADGGGIFASTGELTLVDSTVSGNETAMNGGGVASSAKTVIRGSTLSGNQADASNFGEGGGGLSFSGGEKLTMRDDTVAGNRAVSEGGGILNGGKAQLNSVTVARNRADTDGDTIGPGGGLMGDYTIGNSLIALNTAGASTAPDCRGTFTSKGHNLVANPTIGCDFTGPGDILNQPADIGPLKANGGPTETVALLAGSPAIGAGGATAEKRDQRGRKRDKHPDIGAYEFGAK